jgi:hypothetical protein
LEVAVVIFPILLKGGGDTKEKTGCICFLSTSSFSEVFKKKKNDILLYPIIEEFYVTSK